MLSGASNLLPWRCEGGSMHMDDQLAKLKLRILIRIVMYKEKQLTFNISLSYRISALLNLKSFD